MRLCRTALAAGLATLAVAAPAQAGTINVTRTDDANVCDTSGCTLRGALAAAARASGADTVALPAGIYVITSTLTIVDAPVTIQGAGARTTIIEAKPATPAIDVAQGTVTIAHVTVRNGGAAGATVFGANVHGGRGTQVTLDHVRLTGGQASSGGGAANEAGTMTIDSSLIDSNKALTGGGDGGGVANIGVAATNAGGSLTIRNTTITANQANLGGALSQWQSSQNTTVLINVTVARNVAGGRGGGFIGNASGQINGTYSIRGSVIAGNTQPGPTGAPVANNCNGITPTDLGGNLESGTDCGFRRSDDLQNANPLLGTLINLGGDTDVLPLGAGSPALDFTTRPCLTAVDQRDVQRPQGPGCDAGAFEQRVDYAVGLAPEAATATVGATQAVTATATENGAPLDDATLSFEVLSGPNSGKTEAHGTDLAGHAAMQLTSAAAGVDSIRVSFTDPAGRAHSASATVTWLAPLLPQDRDHDFVPDTRDNCPDIANTDQADRDKDGIGDTCDTALPPGDLPIVVGQVAQVKAVSGDVFIKLPGRSGKAALASQLQPGFVPLKGIATVPVGSIVDARTGTLEMTTAASFAKGRPQRTQSARLAAAMFKIRQARKQRRTRARRAQRPSTDLVMQTPAGLARACASTNSPTVTPIKGVVRSLSGSGKGLFRTVGGGSTTTITNGTWIVNDRCDGTLTEVGRGTATVFDAGRHRTVRVRAGQAYLAKARLFGARLRRGHRPN